MEQKALDKAFKKVGRPTKYRPEYAEQARKACLLGSTNDQLASFFEVHVSTISEWLVEIPEFSEAVKAGRESADNDVAHSLYQRAMGYRVKVTKPHYDSRKGQWVTIEVEEVYPPDPTAMIFWLKNRRPKEWREKLEIEQKVLVVKVEGQLLTGQGNAD